MTMLIPFLKKEKSKLTSLSFPKKNLTGIKGSRP